MTDPQRDTEDLRQKLLEEIWSGALSGLGAMLLDENRIRRAGPEELAEIARQYGMN